MMGLILEQDISHVKLGGVIRKSSPGDHSSSELGAITVDNDVQALRIDVACVGGGGAGSDKSGHGAQIWKLRGRVGAGLLLGGGAENVLGVV